jgi:outer membrane protein OmpA-like peptidoglycan-associated protein
MGVYWLFDPRQGWNLLAKAGLSAISNDASDARIPFEKQTSVQLATGLGVLWQSDSRWFLRADADFYDRDHYYLGLSVGAFWGRRAEQHAEPAAAPQPARVAPPAPEPATPTPIPRPPPPVEPACREVVVALNERIEFELNSAELTAASQAVLSATVRRIRGSAGSDPLVRVGAHTDSAGSDAYNLDLSERRAASVGDYLVTAGLAAARIQARGFGEGRPVADNDTAAGRASNRRVEITWQDTDCQ